jgi:hypothetical protein
MHQAFPGSALEISAGADNSVPLITIPTPVMTTTARPPRRLPAEDPLKMAKYPKYQDAKVWSLAKDDKQAEADKTTRLRALRLAKEAADLAKEAADKDAADRETATVRPKGHGRQLNRSTAPLS